MSSETERVLAQAKRLSDRLAGAEQNLDFENARNVERLSERRSEIARLKAAATAARSRLTTAEETRRKRDCEIRDLCAKAARMGVCDGGATKGRAKLEHQIFKATSGATFAVERSREVANERRKVAGDAYADALYAADAEGFEAEEAERRAASVLHTAERDTGRHVTSRTRRKYVRSDEGERR